MFAPGDWYIKGALLPYGLGSPISSGI